MTHFFSILERNPPVLSHSESPHSSSRLALWNSLSNNTHGHQNISTLSPRIVDISRFLSTPLPPPTLNDGARKTCSRQRRMHLGCLTTIAANQPVWRQEGRGWRNGKGFTPAENKPNKQKNTFCLCLYLTILMSVEYVVLSGPFPHCANVSIIFCSSGGDVWLGFFCRCHTQEREKKFLPRRFPARVVLR